MGLGSQYRALENNPGATSQVCQRLRALDAQDIFSMLGCDKEQENYGPRCMKIYGFVPYNELKSLSSASKENEFISSNAVM